MGSEGGRAVMETETTPEPKGVFTVAYYPPVDRGLHVWAEIGLLA
jgi:hypothetical protein